MGDYRSRFAIYDHHLLSPRNANITDDKTNCQKISNQKYDYATKQILIGEFGDGRAPTTRKFVGGLRGNYKWVSRQNLADDLALHAHALTVNDADESESARMRFGEIRLGDSLNVPRIKRVKIKSIGNFDFEWFGHR